MIYKKLILLLLITFCSQIFLAQTKFEMPDWEGGYPEGCTTIIVGKKATADGSLMVCHTDDSHRAKAWLDVREARDWPEGSMATMYLRKACDTTAMPTYMYVPIGEIPQVGRTYKYFNTTYPTQNEFQLSVGEATTGGKEELKSDEGLIDCCQLVHLMMQRCKTAREAIDMTEELLAKYGWNDWGECLTITDKNEAWYIEIYGPGKGKVGSVWAAVRIPDDEVSVNANGSRILELDLSDPNKMRASANILEVTKELGLWNPDKEKFQFCYVVAERQSLAARRREWRVLSMLAPSLKLDPNAENFPLSVKPDEPVTKEKLVEIYRDYYENTPFDMTKNLTVTDDSGKTIISPLANPFMPYDENKLLKINGGWDWRGERTIARWYTMYATIIQSRSWLPDEIGGVVWYAWDNVASSVYVPMYCGNTDVADSYKVKGRVTGYTRDCAWWAFNRLGTLTAQRWGDMRKDVVPAWDKLQAEMFEKQTAIEKEAFELYKTNPEAVNDFLTKYSIGWENKVYKQALKLGDFLWTKYDEKF